jgi:hypothetical protein
MLAICGAAAVGGGCAVAEQCLEVHMVGKWHEGTPGCGVMSMTDICSERVSSGGLRWFDDIMCAKTCTMQRAPGEALVHGVLHAACFKGFITALLRHHKTTSGGPQECLGLVRACCACRRCLARRCCLVMCYATLMCQPLTVSQPCLRFVLSTLDVLAGGAWRGAAAW